MRKKEAEKKLMLRESLNIDEIYSLYYAGSGFEKSIVIKAWMQISNTLRIPADKIRPTDRFGKDIGVYFFLSDDLDALSQETQKQMIDLGKNFSLKEIKTVDNYVRMFAGAHPSVN
jgi:hypothetical protein